MKIWRFEDAHLGNWEVKLPDDASTNYERNVEKRRNLSHVSFESGPAKEYPPAWSLPDSNAIVTMLFMTRFIQYQKIWKANTKSKNDDNNKTRQWRLPEQIESFVPLQVVGQHGLLWGLIPTDLSLDQISVPQALLQKFNHSCFHNIPQLNSPPTWPTWPQGLLASRGETWLPSLVPRTQYPIQPSWKKVRLPVAKVQQINLSSQKKKPSWIR